MRGELLRFEGAVERDPDPLETVLSGADVVSLAAAGAPLVPMVYPKDRWQAETLEDVRRGAGSAESLLLGIRLRGGGWRGAWLRSRRGQGWCRRWLAR